jgi:hypothetical protein
MLLNRRLAGLALALMLPVLAVQAQNRPTKTIGVESKRRSVDSLIVLNARGASLSGSTLTIDGPQASAILFTDRPVRKAGHIPTAEVLELWKSGSFAKDAPNATVSVFSRDGSNVSDAVVILKQPRREADKIVFDVAVLEGDLGKSDGPVSIFIDTIWFGVGSGGVDYLGHTETKSWAPTWSTYDAPPPDPQPNRGYGPGLATPPEMGGGAVPYTGKCGPPPLLPCY